MAYNYCHEFCHCYQKFHRDQFCSSLFAHSSMFLTGIILQMIENIEKKNVDGITPYFVSIFRKFCLDFKE